MLEKDTVGIICDMGWQFYEAYLGKSGKTLLSDYAYGVLICLEELQEAGVRTVLTCLRGYADVHVPYDIITRRKLEVFENMEVFCFLEKEGNDAYLNTIAKSVWDNANCRMYMSQPPSLQTETSFAEAFVGCCGCVLSGSENPDSNPFHLAAKKLGIPIYHKYPSEYCKIGVETWQETEKWGQDFVRWLRNHPT